MSTEAGASPTESLLRVVARLAGNRSSSVPIKYDEDGLIKVAADIAGREKRIADSLSSQILEDCDAALVLLINERAKAISALWESRGPGDGIPSAELKPDERSRIVQANK
jgi:hypothetical protein